MDIYEKIFISISGVALLACFIALIWNWISYKKADKELRILFIGKALLENNETFIDLYDDLMELKHMIDKNGLITMDQIEQVKKIDIINRKRHKAVETFLELMDKLREEID
ncbi:MAG: hypothetical protein J6Y02_13030 [Pseudobutyrivibrio sp.]|nr:hypothetical protein [Pseudobutyrivibrio sp.]